MITKRVSLTLAAIVGLGLAIGPGARAQVIVQTFTINSGTPISDTFTFNLFNTALGALDSVTIALNSTVTATVDVFNSSSIPQPFTNAQASIPITLNAPDGITDTVTAVAGPINGIAPPGISSYSALPVPANFSQTLPLGDFPAYEFPPGTSTGTFTVTSTAGNYSGSANSSVFFGGSATDVGTITITYLYAPAGTVPEPGATTFFAAGVLGTLGMVIRRRKK
jgi:hypothetical protein